MVIIQDNTTNKKVITNDDIQKGEGMTISKKAKGGFARAKSLSSEKRVEIAKKAVAARIKKSSLPKETHRGILDVLGVKLSVSVLDNDKRVILQNSVFSALGRPSRGRRENSNPLPAFMDASNLEPFINENLRGLAKGIEFVDLNNTKRLGFEAGILPAVCNLYLRARDAGVIVSKNQVETTKQADLIIRGLAEVGIIAMIDEATGYQASREKDALAQIFEAFVAKELQPWIKTFPIDYYKELCRLYKIKYPPLKNNQFPQFFGHVTNNAIYTRLAPELLPELKRLASKEEKKVRLHQFLTEDIGHPKLREHLASVVTILKLSQNKDEFFDKLDLIHPKLNQLD